MAVPAYKNNNPEGFVLYVHKADGNCVAVPPGYYVAGATYVFLTEESDLAPDFAKHNDIEVIADVSTLQPPESDKVVYTHP